MKVFYSEKYTIELPAGHRFPMQQYRLVKNGLIEREVLKETEIFEPFLPAAKTILLAHTSDYFYGFCNGTLQRQAIRRIGFPWSESLVTRSLLIVGGAIAAAEEALRTSVSGNLAGGTHHALPSAGEGYCVFNDISVAALYLLEKRVVEKIGVIDLDVHQGNGNAAILAHRKDCFVFSMHAEKNYPFHKIPSTLDIALADNTEDEKYLQLLQEGLTEFFAFNPDIVFFQAGVDTLKEDSLGRLSLTMDGLAVRDRIVLSECKRRAIPVSLALGGGYSKPIDVMIEAHIQTYRIVKELFEV